MFICELTACMVNSEKIYLSFLVLTKIHPVAFAAGVYKSKHDQLRHEDDGRILFQMSKGAKMNFLMTQNLCYGCWGKEERREKFQSLIVFSVKLVQCDDCFANYHENHE